MSFEDPFIAIQNEMMNSIVQIRSDYKNWLEHREKLNENQQKEFKVEFDEKTLELRNQIRCLKWDIEDMEETYAMYESYPKKLKLSKIKLSEREKFISETKEEFKSIKNDVFDAKYNVEGISYYNLTFDGINGNKYNKLSDTSPKDITRKNDDVKINMESADLIPSNDLRLAKEMEQMIEEENNDLNFDLINDYSSDYNQVYQPTLNVIDSKYDSPFKRVARAFQIPDNFDKKHKYTVVGFISLVFFFCLVPLF